MNALFTLFAIFAIYVSRPAAAGAQDAEHQTVYIVTRSAGAEARALFSARLIKLKAANLRWYDDANVVRAVLPKGSLAQVRSDPEVVLALPDQSTPDPAPPAPASPAAPAPAELAPPPIIAPPPTFAVPQMMGASAFAPGAFGLGAQTFPPAGAGMGQVPMGQPPMMGAGPLGLVDSLAGTVVNRWINPRPACKIDFARTTANYAAAGGEGVIQVKASGSCAWQASPSVPWIRVVSGSGVSGSGVVSYVVAPSDGASRTGSIAISGAVGGSPVKGNATLVVTQMK
jgi:hypothetical protein